jgi:hypothetical protein
VRYLILNVFLIFLCFNLYASTSPIQLDIIEYSNLERQGYSTDQELISRATDKGLLPESNSDFDIQKHLREKNTLIIWLVSPRQYKIDLVDQLKEMNFNKEGVTISNPSAYYVDQINNIIYLSLKKDQIEGYNKKGIGEIFKTIAIQEGDFDTNDGRNAMEIMRDYWGEEEFEWYKKTFPKKFKALKEIDSRKR